MRGEVLHLNRNIVIEGTTTEGDWGCMVNVVGFDTVDTPSVRVDGFVHLNGVQFKNCGQRDTEKAALSLFGITNTSVKTIQNCVFSDSDGWGLNFRFTNNVIFQNNFVVDSLKYGMYLKGNKDVTIKNNDFMKVRERPWYSNLIDYDIIIGIFFDNKYSLESKNMIIENNVVSSVRWFAYALPGHDCNKTDGNFRNNVAHSSQAGWFGTMYNKNCQKYTNFKAYKNAEQGFVNRYMIKQLYLERFTLVDNNNALAINGGAASKATRFPRSGVKNSVIIGKSQETDCDFCYDNSLDCDTSGIYTSIFEKNTYEMRLNEYLLPLHNITFTHHLNGGRQTIDNVEFKNFRDNDNCNDEKAFAIRTNGFV